MRITIQPTPGKGMKPGDRFRMKALTWKEN